LWLRDKNMRTIVPVLAEEREELMGGAVLLAIENL
jgi:hypothetical protein